MSGDLDRAAQSPDHDRRTTAPEAAPPASDLAQLPSLARARAVTDPRYVARANDRLHAQTLLHLQRSHGNAVVQRLIGRRPAAQRDGEPQPDDGDALARRLSATAGQGAPIDQAARARVEQGLGVDLSGVRVHTDAEADRLAATVHAHAFTTGQDMYFRSGAYQPQTSAGQRTIAHEAAHTLQQAAGPVTATPAAGGVAISDPSDAFEQAAERAAQAVTDKDRTVGASPEAGANPFGGPVPVQPLQRAHLPIQRCGGAVHAGCDCAQQLVAEEQQALQSIQRQPDGSGGTATAPPPPATAAADPTAIPADSPYAAAADPLKEVFRASYRNNTKHFEHGPHETLVQVLDKIGLSAVSIASEIYERMQARGIWGFVKDITWVWLTTSRGLTFHATGGGLRAAVNSDPNFCKEFLVASRAYHGMTEMWREMVTPGKPGLHIGAGEDPASVHIDMHQVAVPLNVPMLPIDVNTGYCDYDLPALFLHWGDLQENGTTVFSRADGVRRHADNLRTRVNQMMTDHPDRSGDIGAAGDRRDRAQADLDAIMPRLKVLASTGMEGEQVATLTYNEKITKIGADLDAVEASLNEVGHDAQRGDTQTA